MRDFAFTMYKALVAAPEPPAVDKKDHGKARDSKESKDSDDKKEDKEVMVATSPNPGISHPCLVIMMVDKYLSMSVGRLNHNVIDRPGAPFVVITFLPYPDIMFSCFI